MATRVYGMRRDAWNNSFIRNKFVRGTSISVIDSEVESFYSFFKVESASLVHEEGDLVYVEVSYNGSGAGAQYGEETLGADVLPTYRLELSIGEAPFSEHPKWKELSDEDKFALGLIINGDGVVSPDFTQVGTYNSETGAFSAWVADGGPITLAGDALEFGRKLQSGQTTYKFPSVIWTETTQGTSGMTSSQLNKLGKVSTPRGNPPEPSGGRDWMLTGATQEQSGVFYQTSITWELSDAGGHDSFLYD